ncbi:GH25 family lysozyme, partial [Bifidobacterium olomucense]|uniref:GH25 family lysozyme n=1 Tax=Bifidobacterium olomucense TaxID=2675324 RepID=UPI001F0E20F2
MGEFKNKSKPKRLACAIAAAVAATALAFAPAAAYADMQGVDVSNWQCGADIYDMQADFVVVGTTWGTGQVHNPANCISWGVNQDANRMLADAQASGKKIGIYHYAMGGNPEAEADFFYRNTSNYVRHAVLALDWEADDNPAFGDWDWVRRFMNRMVELTGGVYPMLYTAPMAGTVPQDLRDRYGLWIAQYANMDSTGYQSAPWMIGAYGEAMRQYSGNGVVNTWSPIDLNLFRGEGWQWDLYADPSSGAAPSAPATTPSAPASTPASQSGGISHTMQWGETIWGLAVQYDAWPLSAWHTPSGDINRYWVGDVVTYNGGG